MRFKLDENLPPRAADVLRAAGHDAMHLLEQAAPGATDELVARLARDENRVLVTLDLDFADIRSYPPDQSPGLVVLRPRVAGADEVLRLLTRLTTALQSRSPAGRLWIVDRDLIRVHGDTD